MSLNKTYLSIRLGAAIAVAGLTLGLMGCDNRVATLDGQYEGDYSRIENGVVQSYRVVMKMDPEQIKKGEAKLALQDSVTQRELGLITLKKKGSKLLLSSSMLAGSSEIELEDRGVCADSKFTTVCLKTEVFSLFSTDETGGFRVLLYLNRVGSDPLKASESVSSDIKDGAFALSDLWKRVLTTSYDTRIAAEKLFQAHQEVKVVRSRLFPSMSLGGIISLVNYPLSAASMIGSLVPFIFPSNWFDFKREAAVYEGEVMSYKALVANQMNLVEDMVHAIVRDQQLLVRYQNARTILDSSREMVSLRVGLGYAPESDLMELEDLIYKNQADISQMEQGLVSQVAILSRGVGLSPRTGIKTLVAPELIPIATRGPLNPTDIMAEALSGSLEIRQVMFLEKAAELHKLGEAFSFINPSEWIGFNEGTIHKIKIAQSALREVQLMRKNMENKVEEQVISLTSLHNQLLDQNRILELSLANRHKNLEQVESLYQGGYTSILAVRSALEGVLRVESEVVNAQSALASVIGKINRLCWKEGYVEALNLEIPRSFF